ncbi:MAG TPA: sulfate adenylyltransferase [Candidatus Dormibacteraeota bacterium]
MTTQQSAAPSHHDSPPAPAVALVDRLLSADEGQRRLAALDGAPRIALDSRQQADVHCIAVGAFSPLTGFIGSADHESVCATMQLTGGAVWSMPVVLAVDAETARARRPGDSVVLLDTDSEPLALMDVSEVFTVDLQAEVEACYGTADPAHPGVAARLAQGEHALAGEIHALRTPTSAFPTYDLTPTQTRARFAELGWRTVVGFQTRNPVHRAHEYLHKVALESIDGLFLNPLVGDTKGDDISAATRMRCYEVLLEKYYPQNRVVLGTFPAAMRYAGPREAVLHSIVRRNYGCTHFIVGRDHAGVGKYYGTYDAQRIFDTIDPTALGIEIFPFEHSFWCHHCEGMASTRTCPHPDEDHLVLSGTRVREMLLAGELPPPEFSRPEVASILIEAARQG